MIAFTFTLIAFVFTLIAIRREYRMRKHKFKRLQSHCEDCKTELTDNNTANAYFCSKCFNAMSLPVHLSAEASRFLSDIHKNMNKNDN